MLSALRFRSLAARRPVSPRNVLYLLQDPSRGCDRYVYVYETDMATFDADGEIERCGCFVASFINEISSFRKEIT